MFPCLAGAYTVLELVWVTGYIQAWVWLEVPNAAEFFTLEPYVLSSDAK